MKCNNCGKDLGPNEKFCTNCGANNKEKTKIPVFVIIIIIVIAILIIAGITFLVIRFTKNQHLTPPTVIELEKGSDIYIAYPKPEKKYLQISPDTKVLPEKENDINKNIEILDVFMGKGTDGGIDTNDNEFGDYIVIYGKNNNDFPVNIKVNLDLYDSENYKVKNNYENAYVIKPNKEFTIELRSELKADDDIFNYKMTFDAKKIDDYYTDLNITKDDIDVKIASKRNNVLGWIDGTITNKTANKIYSATILAKFYNNGKLVNIDSVSIYDLIPNEPKEFQYVSWKMNNNAFEYNNVEYDIVSAYLFEKENW